MNSATTGGVKLFSPSAGLWSDSRPSSRQHLNMFTFRTKRDVDMNVEHLHKQYPDPKERSARFISVARAYMSVREFAIARRYLQTYIDTHSTDKTIHEAYKLMGDILMELNEMESALDKYKKSYELSPIRVTLNRICDILHNGFGENETPESRKSWFNRQKNLCESDMSSEPKANSKSESVLSYTSQVGSLTPMSFAKGANSLSFGGMCSPSALSFTLPSQHSLGGAGAAPSPQGFGGGHTNTSYINGSGEMNQYKTQKQNHSLLSGHDSAVSAAHPEAFTEAQQRYLDDKFKQIVTLVTEYTTKLTAQKIDLETKLGDGLSRMHLEFKTLVEKFSRLESTFNSAIKDSNKKDSPSSGLNEVLREIKGLTEKLSKLESSINSQVADLKCSEFKNRVDLLLTEVKNNQDSKSEKSTSAPAAPLELKTESGFGSASAFNSQVSKPLTTSFSFGQAGIGDFAINTELTVQPEKPNTSVLPDFSFPKLSSTSFGFGDLPKNSGFSFGNSPAPSIFTASAAPVFAQKLPSTPVAQQLMTAPVVNTSGISHPPAREVAEAQEEEEEEFVPTAEFTPVIALPPLVEVRKGDEDEDTVFEARAKLFRLHEGKEWKERGTGNIKILQHKVKKSKARIVMWREQIHKLACNHYVEEDTNVSFAQNSETKLKWGALDFADGEPTNELFTCKFAKPEQCKEFKSHVDRLVAEMKKSPETPPETRSEQTIFTTVIKETTEPHLIPLSQLMKKPEGSWTCSGCYVNNIKDQLKCISCEQLKPGVLPSSVQPKSLSTALPQPFTFSTQPVANSGNTVELSFQSEKQKTAILPDFTFGPLKTSLGFGDIAKNASGGFGFEKSTGPSIFTAPVIPMFTPKNPTSLTSDTGNPDPSGEEGETHAEEFVPTAEFTPVIPLPPLVEVKKGDEDEDTVFEARAKLFRLHEGKEWKERGTGNIKILQHKVKKNKVRIVMWRDQIHKLACNHYIEEDTNVRFAQNSDNKLMWGAMDFAEGEPTKELFTCKFGKAEHCKEFKSHIDRVIGGMKQSPPSSSEPGVTDVEKESKNSPLKPLSELLKKPEGSWTCKGCYLTNTKDQAKCPSCEELKPGVDPSSIGSKTSTALPQFAFGFKPKTAAPGAEKNVEEQEKLKASVLPNFSFGQAAGASVGFGDLAKSVNGGFGFGKSDGPNIFTAPIVPMFSPRVSTAVPTDTGNPNPSGEEGESHAEEFVPTAEFTPVIPLPPLVEVKKGDEDEDTVFEVRAKLFRLHENKEWKERGTGNIKILQHKVRKNKVRIVMWREQIHKLACNHYVDGDTQIKFAMNSDTKLMWGALDFAEDEPTSELFTCKFGKAEQCKEFKTHFDRLVAEIKRSPSTPSSAGQPTETVNPKQVMAQSLKPLSELVKKAEGSWTCNGCYLTNGKDQLKCPSCEALQPGVDPSSIQSSRPAFSPQFSFGFSAATAPTAAEDYSDSENFDFSKLENRKVPTYPDQTMTPEEYAEFLKENPTEVRDQLANFSFTSSNSTTSPEKENTTSSFSSPFSAFGTGSPAGSSIFSTPPTNPPPSFGTPTFNLSSSPFGGIFPNSNGPANQILFSAPAHAATNSQPLVQANQEEDDDYEDVDDEEDEPPIYEGEAELQIRYPGVSEYSELGKGIISLNYDHDLYCTRFSFTGQSNDVVVEHVICADTHLQSVGDSTFAWSGLSEMDDGSFARIELQATFQSIDLYNSLLDRWSDSQDTAAQAGVTEEYLTEPEQGTGE